MWMCALLRNLMLLKLKCLNRYVVSKYLVNYFLESMGIRQIAIGSTSHDVIYVLDDRYWYFNLHDYVHRLASCGTL